ncbi:hypothetical protein C4577_04210 [Candidatus Parcubacteria bacterium]|nr:MAG: hypothetical protein C4577_04210 [Candidatus Parcubacteria bacterium]
MQYKTTVIYDKTFAGKDTERYKFKHFNPINQRCCQIMTDYWNSGFVALSKHGHDGSKPVVQLEWKEPDYDDITNCEESINFCPWCGEKIELKEIERVKEVKSVTKVTKVVEQEIVDIKYEKI